MTSSAPIDRTRSTFRVLQTPVTSVPNARAICTANVPTPPEAPLMRTFCPGWIRPWSRRPSRAVLAAIGTAAACSNDRFFGFGAQDAELWVAQPKAAHQAPDVRLASHVVPVIGVDGGGAHPDQHLVVAGHGLVDVRELQDVR